MYDELLAKRFWKLVERKSLDECWPWKGTRTKQGYGRYVVVIGGKQIKRASHRIAYDLTFPDNPLPADKQACHRCDNLPCNNPHHIFPGTNKQNSGDRHRKGRSAPKTGELNGRAKLTTAQVALIRSMAEGGWKPAQLAKKFNVARQTISDIIHNKRWQERS